MRPETLVEISLAVERFRRHNGTTAEKKRLAGYVAEMIGAIRQLARPGDDDVERVRLAVCFLCSGQVGRCHCAGQSVGTCPFHLHD